MFCFFSFQNTTYEGRNTLAKQLNISESSGGPKVPLLAEILKRPQGEKVGRPIGIEVYLVM